MNFGSKKGVPGKLLSGSCAKVSTLEKLSGGRWLWGPSLEAIARKGSG